MKIVVGNAWPYANGPLHIGRVSAWLPGDAIARYHRAKGDDVVFVSGSDCHGELVLKKANVLKKSPKFVSDYYHEKFKNDFEKLDFSFDNFAKTSGEYHEKTVKEFIKILSEKGLIYSKEVEVYKCYKCNEEVGDRFIENNKHTSCDGVLKNETVDKLFFKLSTFEDYLKKLISKELGWKDNALKLTKRYLDEGLRDRVLSRDIEWGIDIPIENFTDKKVFVWIEAVMGYMSASKKVIEERNEEFTDYWNTESARIYLLHGKDNIPFHCVVMPCIVAGLGYEECNIRILSSEHMELEGKKFSSNRNWVVWLDYIIKKYDSDVIRYYLLSTGINNRGANFTWREFINKNNTELLGIYGNFINRTLSFIDKYYEGSLGKQRVNKSIESMIVKSYEKVSRCIEAGNINIAINEILKLTVDANNYFDNEKPWILFKNDPNRCKEVMYNCSLVVSTLGNLLEPIIPKTADKIRKMLNIDKINFKFEELENINITMGGFLFSRIDTKQANEELYILKKRK